MNIIELNGEIQAKVNTVRSTPAFTSPDLTNEQKNQLNAALEKTSNMQKYCVRRLFEILSDAYDSFEEIASSISTCENEDDMVSDHDVLLEMRNLSMKLIDGYIKDLHDISFPPYLVAFYIASLRRMLYKGCDSILKEAIVDYLQECRDTASEEIDNIYCLGMTQGSFDGSDVEACRETLQLMILINSEMRDALYDLPFSHELIQGVQDDIQEHVQLIIRQVQLQFADKPEFLEEIMDLDVLDDTDDFEEDDDDLDDEDDDEVYDIEDIAEEEPVVESDNKKGGKKRKSEVVVVLPSSTKKAKAESPPSPKKKATTPKKETSKKETKKAKKNEAPVASARSRNPPKKYE